jgi:hypothetical protein
MIMKYFRETKHADFESGEVIPADFKSDEIIVGVKV